MLQSNFNFGSFQHDRDTLAMVIDPKGRLIRWKLDLDWHVPKRERKLCQKNDDDIDISAFDDFRSNRDIDDFQANLFRKLNARKRAMNNW